ncbi:uncharacterized protein EMH_0097880 [Eimeria mitis]|uniref:Uncharacterized protein n=1 Tax=Eimeria mitis TaxID=44415 RepID=U6KFE4_9EIME|nr:uncharacterized protein EMH_0097880 [Eimeria mitis]CDJ35496.1 hypothetical protein EMH_0097880 [Eimeria mitis]
MFFFSLLLLILIIKDRDNDRYREPEYTAAAGGAAEPVQGAPEAVVPPPQEVQGPESSKAIVAPEGDGYAPEGKMPQAEAQAGSVDCRASHSEGANEVVAHNGIGPRMASIP